ncbi:MAG: glycoside hydrolase family 127 protein, partial [Candidatus Aminicenantes bacterium]|nr:glycoside hydrolase family 127 protein [Candidatus Aminicenantes bacterium]
MKKKMVGAAVLVLIWSGLTPASLEARPAPESPKVKVQDKIPSQAYSFELGDVRLLDGPFRDAMLRDQKYLLELDADRLLHNFRVTAGLPSTAEPLGGWEDPKGELRGHSVGHFLTACGLMYAATGDTRFKDKGNGIVAELAKVQDAMPSRGFNKGFLSAYPEEFFDRVDKRIRVWAPYYTLHKIMAGLLDMYFYCNNEQALDVVTKLAGWVKFRVDRLTQEQQQAALETEFGGMNEVLANLYGVTGNPDHLTTAFKFDHKKLFDQWAAGEDNLDGLHGNTQFPKVIGAFREYQLTGQKRYLDIARFFWDRVALHRSFVIGGNTNGERFFPIDQFSRNLGPSSTETCNTYNMLKLTRQLFGLEPAAEKMDFYERGLFNHILASQDPATGMVCYYVPLRPGAFKTYSTPNDSFWCCVGTGMENHAKYGDTIFFHDDRSLYLNLFIASELNWQDKGLVVRQETKFPEEETTRLTFRTQRPVRLALKIRQPAWLSSAMTVTVNGRRESVKAGPNGYATFESEWKNGDTVEVRWPMGLRLEAMPDDPKMIALLYGPVVLAGDLGREGLTEALRYGPNAPPVNRLPAVMIPVFI